MPRIMKEVFGKVLNEKFFIVDRPKSLAACLDTGHLHKFMKRILVFDLPYLKELKRDTFRSDFDELQFAIALLFDVTRSIADKDPTTIHNDNLKMTRAFTCLKNRVGVMVPSERLIKVFRELSEEAFRRKMSLNM